jgi:AcrR family transcriptional regulator
MVAQKLSTEIRQKQIVKAALKLAAPHGLKGVSIIAIANEVGLVPSAVYRHFKNKDQVIDAIFDHIADQLQANVKKVSKKEGDVLERLRWLLMLHIQLIQESQGILRIVFSEEVMSGPPERKAKVYAIIREYLGAVADMIRKGQEKGEIRADIDPGTTSVTFLGLIQTSAILWHLSGYKFDVANHAGKAWKMFLEGIASQKQTGGQLHE